MEEGSGHCGSTVGRDIRGLVILGSGTHCVKKVVTLLVFQNGVPVPSACPGYLPAGCHAHHLLGHRTKAGNQERVKQGDG